MKWVRESVKRVAETELLEGDLKLAIKMNNKTRANQKTTYLEDL
jgi:hypothetical protein